MADVDSLDYWIKKLKSPKRDLATSAPSLLRSSVFTIDPVASVASGIEGAEGALPLPEVAAHTAEEHSYDALYPWAAGSAGFLLLLLVASALVTTRCRQKKGRPDSEAASILVYPSQQGSTPQFLSKEIHFSLPPLRSSSLSDLNGENDDSESEISESLLMPTNAHSKRSNSFSCYGLGVIEPALYRSTLELDEWQWPEGHLGRVFFSLRYEQGTEKLLVSLLKAKNLPSRTVGTVNSCDPFVRLHLLPDERRFLQSRQKENGCYGLGVIEPALYRSTLELDEWQWPEGHLGRVFFSLRYEQGTEKLLVSLLKAKNLPSRTVGTVNSCDPFVRLHLLPDERRFLQSRQKENGCYGLGVIEPALYRSTLELDEWQWPEGHLGRVFFSLRYEQGTEKLLVSLLKAKNLPSRTVGTVNSCDPFVRLHLLPDERRFLQSKQKKKTCNPYFDETLVFQVSAKDMTDHTLKLTVIDAGRTKRRQELGHVIVPLRDLNMADNSEQQLFKMDLEKEAQETISDLGELLVSLLYNENLKRLTATVIEARGLKGDHNLYVKLTLNQQYRVVKEKKTGMSKERVDGSVLFSEGFHLRIPPAQLDATSVAFHVLQATAGYGRDRLLGKCVLGSYMFARGKALQHWSAATQRPMEQVQHWHKLSE